MTKMDTLKKETNKEYYTNNKKNWNNYQKIQRQKIREKIEVYKKARVCKRCGFEDYRALIFHHTGIKSFSISKATTNKYGTEKLYKEMERCDLICGNCHLIEHYGKNTRLKIFE